MSRQNDQLVGGYQSSVFNPIKWCPKCMQYSNGNYCSVCGTPLEDKQQEIDCPCCHGKGKITVPFNDTYYKAYNDYIKTPLAVINGNTIKYKMNNGICKNVEYNEDGTIIGVKYTSK